MPSSVSDGSPVVECSICGKPIENIGPAWAAFEAFVDANGNEMPGTHKRTGPVAHGSCVARHELLRSPGDPRE